jgi:hypothetical protein
LGDEAVLEWGVGVGAEGKEADLTEEREEEREGRGGGWVG